MLAFYETNPETQRDIWMLRIDDEPTRFLVTRLNESTPMFSPDGHRVAYLSDETGQMEVFVSAYPGGQNRRLVSADGGTEPVWSPDGRELFYRHGDEMMVVSFDAPSGFPSAPTRLFAGPFLHDFNGNPNYAVSPDGQRFLMIRSALHSPALSQIHVVQNWFEDLKRLVPVD